MRAGEGVWATIGFRAFSCLLSWSFVHRQARHTVDVRRSTSCRDGLRSQDRGRLRKSRDPTSTEEMGSILIEQPSELQC